MKDRPLVSVIVPVYKVEQYLGRCLDSVINQTYDNWECLCINDGSPDNSLQVLEEYAAKDSRIRVFDMENNGVSVARNLGMDVMMGEYLIFIDSDDFIHPQLLEICVYQALRDGSDLVVYRRSNSYGRNVRLLRKIGLGDYIPRYSHYKKENVPSVITDDIFAYVTNNYHDVPQGIDKKYMVRHCHVWRALYHRSVVEDLRFCLGIRFEDVVWYAEMLLRVKRVTINNLKLYYYYPNKLSFMNGPEGHSRIRHLRNAISVVSGIYEEKASEEQRKVWKERFERYLVNALNGYIEKFGDVE